MKELINHPDHYNDSIECIVAMRAAFGDDQVETFCRANAFKYIWRAEKKGNKLQDMFKAQWYINYSIKLLQNKQNNGTE